MVVLDGFSRTVLKGQAPFRSKNGYPTTGKLGFVFMSVAVVILSEVVLSIALLAFVQMALAIVRRRRHAGGCHFFRYFGQIVAKNSNVAIG